MMKKLTQNKIYLDKVHEFILFPQLSKHEKKNVKPTNNEKEQEDKLLKLIKISTE